MFYCEIFSGLWCGDVELMNSNKFIIENDINIIVNCTIEYETPSYKDVIKKKLPFSEQLRNKDDFKKLNDSLDRILEYLKDNIEDDKNILLCCYDGLNVSALICSLYLKKFANIEDSVLLASLKSKDERFSLDYNLSLFTI